MTYIVSIQLQRDGKPAGAIKMGPADEAALVAAMKQLEGAGFGVVELGREPGGIPNEKAKHEQ